MTDLNDHRKTLVQRYFRLVDAGQVATPDIYTADVEYHFPKWGVSHGVEQLVEFAARLGDGGSITHDIEGLDHLFAGDRVVVEGREWGTTPDGRSWPDGEVSTGRFCNVFTFEGDLISRLFVYVDPDFESTHREKVEQLHRG